MPSHAPYSLPLRAVVCMYIYIYIGQYKRVVNDIGLGEDKLLLI